MTRQRWIDIASIAAAVGGLSWLAKIAVIVATDGRVDNEGAAAFFFLMGAFLMLAGSTAIGVRLAGGRSRLVLILSTALSPILFLVSFVLLEGLTKPLVGDRGASYWQDEVGILATGLAWLVVGMGLYKAAHRSRGHSSGNRGPGSTESATVVAP